MAKQLYGYALIASRTTKVNMSRVCTNCKKRKSLDKFYANKMGKHGKSSHCKACRNEYQKNRHKPQFSTHRKCSICNRTRLVKFFKGRQKTCDKCLPTKRKLNNEYKKKWHNTRGITTKEYIFNVLSKSSCNSCGETDVLVLEFDHLRNKLFNIGQAHMSKKITIAKLKKEIAKCQVLCSNCHTRKTAQEQNTWRYQKATGKV